MNSKKAMLPTVFTRSQIPFNFWAVVKILLAIALLGYVASKTDFSQLIALHDRFSWMWFGISFLLFGAMVVIKAMQYYYLIGKKLSYFRLLEIVVLQNALMNFVATAAGIASYLAILSNEKDVRIGRAAISFLIVKMGDLIAVIIFLLSSWFFIQPVSETANRIAVATSVFILFLIIIFFSTILSGRKFTNEIRKILTLFHVEKVSFVQKGLDLLDSTKKQDPKAITRLITGTCLLSLVYIGLTMIWGYARLRMFSLYIDIGIVTFVNSILQIASWVPIYVLGGLGVSETLSIYLFGLFGESQIELAAIMIGIRIMIYLMNASSLLYLPLRTLIRAKRGTE